MAYATWGRSLATQPSAGPVGDDTIPPAAQPPGLIPGSLEHCPMPCVPRPRDLPQFQAASAAAQGDCITEHYATEIMPDMVIWYNGRFLIVDDIRRERGVLEIVLATEYGVAVWRMTTAIAAETSVCRRVGATC